MTKPRLLVVAALAATLAAAGCVPSDAEIAAEMDASRREAYYEWKARRERGERSEAKVDGPLSLDDAVRLALQYNKALQANLQNREIQRGNRIADYKVVLPSLTMRGTAARRENGRENTDIDNYSTSLTVNQPIFEGEAIPARLRTARLETALTDETVRENVQDLIQMVASNYYDILLAQHMVETHREALVSAEAQYRMVSEKKKQETATDYDVLRAQVDVATYRAQMISAQNDIDTNRVALLKNMGVSQDSEITFSDRLEFLPMRPVFERAVEIASGNRPDLRQAELNARIDEEAVRIARSAWWPTLAGTFTSSWRDGWNGRNDSFGRNPWEAGLTASYTLGIDNAGNLIAAKARAKQSQIAVLDQQETTLKEIREQMNTLANAEEMVKALVVNQDAAREALRLVLVGYQAGVKTEVDVTDARKALTDVQGQYYKSLTDHTKARLNLQVAMGILGPARISDAPLMPPSVPIANIEEFAATDYVPPQPIRMPSADELAPVSRTAEPLPPVSQARPDSDEGTPRRPAAVVTQAPAPYEPAPVALPDPVAVMTPVAAPAASAVAPVVQSAPAESVAPVAPTAKPMFRVKVRTQNAAGAPEVARAG